MSGSIAVLGAAAAGAGLGLFYFLGLWLTLRHLPGRRHPALWVMGSFLLRLAVTLSGFYWILGEEPIRLGVALLCFIAVRVMTLRRLRPFPDSSP